MNEKYIFTVLRGRELEISLSAAAITLIHCSCHHYVHTAVKINCLRLTLLGNSRARESFSGAGIQVVKGILHQERRCSAGHLSSTSDTPGPCLQETINPVVMS